MKNIYFHSLSSIFLLFILLSCASPEKLTSKGWQYYEKGEYGNATTKFNKALDKKNVTRAFEGLAFVNYKLRNYNSAEQYIKTVYERNKNSSSIYNYACFSNLNGNSKKAMRLLYELGNQSDFEKYRKLSVKDEDLNSLRGSKKFQRYLSGFRRIKISPYELFSTDEDGLTSYFHNQNELFVTVSNNNYLILSTKITDNNDHVFLNDYVIFDYPLGSKTTITLMDEDIYQHDKLIQTSGTLLDLGDFKFTGNGFMKIKMEDTEELPYTTGLFVPSERKLLNDLLLVAGAYYVLPRMSILDNTIVTRMVSCGGQYKVGTLISDPLNAAIVAEGVRKVIENKGDIKNIGITTFTNYLASELRSSNHNDLANLLDASVVYNCIFGN